ncbi:hypothetical protein GQR58_020881 [Nymphon striatum]|nr:hypothetical protein GQR58_020881 [Nymphon striatum]
MYRLQPAASSILFVKPECYIQGDPGQSENVRQVYLFRYSQKPKKTIAARFLGHSFRSNIQPACRILLLEFGFGETLSGLAIGTLCHFQSGTIFPPIVPTLNQLNINTQQLISKFSEKEALLCKRWSIMQNGNVDTILSHILGTEDSKEELTEAINVVTEIELGLNAVSKAGKLNKFEPVLQAGTANDSSSEDG